MINTVQFSFFPLKVYGREWSAQPVVIVQQLWAVLIISQVLQAIRLEIAGLAQVDPFDVSLALVTQYVPQLAFEGKNPIKMIIEDGRRVGIIRPSRRIRPQTPAIDLSQMNPLPRETQLTRTPRYAQRKCDSASYQKAKKNAVKSP